MHIIFVIAFLQQNVLKMSSRVRKRNPLSINLIHANLTCPLNDLLGHHGNVCMCKAYCSMEQEAYNFSCSACNQKLLQEGLDKKEFDLGYLRHNFPQKLDGASFAL